MPCGTIRTAQLIAYPGVFSDNHAASQIFLSSVRSPFYPQHILFPPQATHDDPAFTTSHYRIVSQTNSSLVAHNMYESSRTQKEEYWDKHTPFARRSEDSNKVGDFNAHFGKQCIGC